MVAHRLPTVQRCTSIAAIYRGHVLEQGSHEELLVRGLVVVVVVVVVVGGGWGAAFWVLPIWGACRWRGELQDACPLVHAATTLPCCGSAPVQAKDGYYRHLWDASQGN